MRVKLGILGPLYLQVAILFLYSTIRYQILDRSLVVVILLLLFPSLILTVLAPFIISIFANLNNRLQTRLSSELDDLIRSERSWEPQEESKTLMIEELFLGDSHKSEVSDSIKKKLVPLLSKRSLAHYKDNFYSRTEKIKPVRSLEYFESLVLFASINSILFIFDIIVVWIMNFQSLPFYFIKLDKIEDPGITISVTIFLLLGLAFSYMLFFYSRERLIHYLPYVVPILFHEPEDEKYFRRETIRSLTSYNLDNLIDRKDQKKYRESLGFALDELLVPLLRDEFLISARSEFASKIAWREFASVIQSEGSFGANQTKSILERFLLGEKIGPVKLNEKDLLGLYSDQEYIKDQLYKWDSLSREERMIVYFQLYRLTEFIFREITLGLNLVPEDEEYNLYNSIKILFGVAYLSEDDKKILNNLRYRRNKLMHEPGISLEVSAHSVSDVITTITHILEILQSEEIDQISSKVNKVQKLDN
ncbi:MAG: hypothetical protein GPJ54_13555 [Candidatus Heimdallarchaeota archaeon]|nr:hypothetical protein [Candidatus Heimdallarchaeota archaeon]